MGIWIAIELEQHDANRDAIGSWVEVKTGDHVVQSEVTIGGGHAGDQLGWIHFGLGPSERVEIRVQWPDGETGPWLKVNANQFVTIVRGAQEAKVWVPGQG